MIGLNAGAREALRERGDELAEAHAIGVAYCRSLLQYLRAESRRLRTVTILKSRASAHDPEIREFEITPDGIVLGDPIAAEHVQR